MKFSEEEVQNLHFDGLTVFVAKTIVFTTLAKSPEIWGFFAPLVSQKWLQKQCCKNIYCARKSDKG
jgi:hypothetical protein